MSKTYGYARVSSREQNTDRQLLALEEFGVSRKDIYIDKQSGKDFARPQYQRLLKRLRANDVLVIKSIDRLGRNYTEIQNQWRILTKEKTVAVVVIDMPLLDTRNTRDLTGIVIADIVLQLLSYLAEKERDFIRQRQAEGIAAAKLRGVKFGRPRLSKPDNFSVVYESWKKREINCREAGRLLGVSHYTFLRWTKE